MKRFLAFAFLYIIFIFSLSAQQQWYFGNGAGLDFSSIPPKSLFNGKLFTLEGCASASDEKGNLLFYTDGLTIWNKSHGIMQNGTGLNGSQSSSQAALIVPQPGVKGLFFLFVVDEKGGKKGLSYSVVDITSGEGSVVRKNIQLLDQASEKIAIAHNANGKGFWVITHQWNSNNFFVYPVAEDGLGDPIVSGAGLSHAETGAGENREAIGCLAVSPDEKKIACAVCYRPKNNLELFDFNNATGKVSNAAAVTLSGSPYGLCFSPDNTKLYVSFLKGRSGVVQYDMNEKTSVEIAPSKKDNTFGTLKSGPDGKIYVARAEDYLDVIERPDQKSTACNYRGQAVDLSPATSNFGLPNVFFTRPVFSPAATPPSANVSVPSKNTTSLTSSQPKPVVTNASSKNGFDCAIVIEKPFTKSTQMVMTDISVCDDEYTLTAKNFGGSFNWSTLETTQKIIVKVSGLYRVAISREGCTVTDSIRIHFRKEAAVFNFLPGFNPETEFLNGEFYYEIDDVKNFELKVYDKRKNVLFETTNIKRKWNGKNPKGNMVAAGDYFWSVQYTPNCPKDSKPIVQYGKVTVKRSKK